MCTTARYFPTPDNAPENRSQNGTDDFLRGTRVEKSYHLFLHIEHKAHGVRVAGKL